MDDELFEKLINKYIHDLASEDEIAYVDKWYDRIKAETVEMPLESMEDLTIVKQKIFSSLQSYIGQKDQKDQVNLTEKSVTPIWWWIAGFVWIILIGSGIYFWWEKFYLPPSHSTAHVTQITSSQSHHGASLSLSDGSKILLGDNSDKTLVPNQGGASVEIKDNKLFYYKDNNTSNDKIAYNTLSTPLGKQYGLMLSDSTKVWLNAGSSLSYPTIFSGAQRVVTLKGEGYFEVAKNNSQPFIVVINGVTVQVLGTHFNVNGYEEDPDILITLLEGSVRIAKGALMKLISPGQQARVLKQSDSIIVNKIDTSASIAWKNHYFYFNKAEVGIVMRQIARWYNLKVNYTGKFSDLLISATLAQDQPLSGVLDSLRKDGLKIDQKGEVVTVSR